MELLRELLQYINAAKGPPKLVTLCLQKIDCCVIDDLYDRYNKFKKYRDAVYCLVIGCDSKLKGQLNFQKWLNESILIINDAYSVSNDELFLEIDSILYNLVDYNILKIINGRYYCVTNHSNIDLYFCFSYCEYWQIGPFVVVVKN